MLKVGIDIAMVTSKADSLKKQYPEEFEGVAKSKNKQISLALFLDKFNDILSRISKDNKQCYVIGDFNLDLLQYNHHTPTQEFIDTLFSHAFIPLISNPTRLTSYSATIIDNILRNNLSQNVSNGIVLNDLSYHLRFLVIFLAKLWSAMEKSIHTQDYWQKFA